MDFSYSCRIFGNGAPGFEFSTAVSAGSGKRRPQPAANSNKLSGINNLETKHNVRNQSRYLCVLHSCRPSTRSALSGIPPRCHRIHIIPTRHNVYQVLYIDTRRRGTGQYCTAVHIYYVVYNVSYPQYRKKQHTHQEQRRYGEHSGIIALSTVHGARSRIGNRGVLKRCVICLEQYPRAKSGLLVCTVQL